MNFLPIYVPPYDDELLYSWINRLIAINGLSYSSFVKAYIGLNYDVLKLPDVRLAYVKLVEHLYTPNVM